MVAFTFTAAAASVAALASIASAAPAAGGAPFFRISTCAAQANSKFSGLYLAEEHIGAGENAIVALPTKKGALEVQFNGTVIYEYISSTIEYTLHLDNTRPETGTKSGKVVHTAPKGYNVVDIGVDGATKGFSTPVKGSSSQKPISYKGSKDFETFVLCEVSGVAEITGKQIQLLYRTTESKPDTTGKCADVTLYALFSSETTGKFPGVKKC